MNVLRQPCVRLIQRSYEFTRVSALRPLFRNLDELNHGNVFTSHASKCFASSQVIENETDDGPIKRFIKKFAIPDSSKTRLRVASYKMYGAVADSIKYEEIFMKFNMPNTFNSWFLITELHVWMLMVRAMAEGAEKGQDGNFVRNCIVEAMWSDVNKRAKKLNAGNSSEIRQQIHILSEQFQAALITYDEGLMFDDKVLAGALWRRFFEKKCDNYEHLEMMVKYVRQQIHQLEKLNRQDLFVKPKIEWSKIGDV